jgi:radical SAM protein with 4Fe4S-binding SPASM domain
MHKLSAPIEVTLEITKKCNLNCLQCFSAEDRTKNNKELTKTELLTLGDEFGRLKVFTVVFSGGEPLLHNDFFEIASHFIKNGIDVGFSTNGTLVSEHIANDILRHGLGSSLQVSVDGSSSPIHDMIRGNGSFYKTLNGIRNLVNVGIRPSIAVTVLKHNIDDANRIIDFAIEENCRHVHFMFLMPSGNANKNMKDINPERKQLLDLSADLRMKRDRIKDQITIDWGNIDHCPTLPDLSPSSFSDVDNLYAGCPAGKVKAVIDAFGNVFGCDVLRQDQFNAGNIRDMSFERIWQNSNVFNLWRARGVDTLKGKCMECYYSFACVGGCPAFSVANGGDLFDGDPTCDIIYKM